jgi:hypothetical protein
MTRITAIIAALMMVLLLPLIAIADGAGACTFTGTVTTDNAEVADGTLITATIAGDEYYTHTSTVLGHSTYSLTISAPDGKTYANGTKVTFKIGDRNTGETATFQADANLGLNLTASTTSNTSTLSTRNIAVIVGSVIAILALAAAIYYVLFLRRVLRIAGWPRVRGAVPSEEAIPAAEEDQPMYRYIWDKTKLAWVENTALVGQQPQMQQSVTRTLKANVRINDKAGISNKIERGTMPAEEALPAAEEGQPIYRYVWDKTKLAWVENTALVGRQPPMKQSATGTVKANVRVPDKAGTRQKMEQDTSVTLDSQKRVVVKKRGTVLSEEALPAADEGETYNRYIWDNIKLAWVENPSLKARQPLNKQSVADGAKANISGTPKT